MNREEYTQRVLSALGRLTPKEISAVRTEIEGHIEDHMESLLELGYDEKLAEERTMAAMGDPEEVGRELNKQYPIRWQILKDIATAFTGILLVLALFLGSSYSDFWQSLVVRFDPVRGSGDEPMGWTERQMYTLPPEMMLSGPIRCRCGSPLPALLPRCIFAPMTTFPGVLSPPPWRRQAF